MPFLPLARAICFVFIWLHGSLCSALLLASPVIVFGGVEILDGCCVPGLHQSGPPSQLNSQHRLSGLVFMNTLDSSSSTSLLVTGGGEASTAAATAAVANLDEFFLNGLEFATLRIAFLVYECV